MRARWLVLLALIALVPAPRAVGADCVQVGVLGEFKRPTAQTGEVFGTVMRRGVDLGAKALAETPGSGCFKVHDIDFDNSVANIGDVIRSAVRQWGIRYFIGLGTSDQVHAALPALKETGALLFTPTATDDDLNDRANRIVMMFPRNSQMAGAMAAAAAKQGIREVVTVYAENSRFSANMAAEFRESLKRSGGKVVREIAVRTGKVDLEPLLVELRKQPFTHVFAPLYEMDAAQTVSFFVKHGLTFRKFRANRVSIVR
jgi:ABC-type branched-subunit amino acid transport system substrate-binding protein